MTTLKYRDPSDGNWKLLPLAAGSLLIPSDANPAQVQAASAPGISPNFSRADHIHRAPAEVVGYCQKSASTAFTTTSNFWVTNNTSIFTNGGITVESGGLRLPVAGWYEVTAQCRFQTTAAVAAGALFIGDGTNTVAICYLPSWSAVAHNISPFLKAYINVAANYLLQWGGNCTVANVVTMHGANTAFGGLSARLLR